MQLPLLSRLALVLATATTATCSALAAEVRMTGATTTFISLVKEQRESVATETGLTITATGATTGKGMSALLAGEVEIAMTTDHLANLAQIAAAKGTPFNADDYTEHYIREGSLLTVIHPSNPVTNLTPEQVKDILTGTVKNWRDVGGPDAPIAVYYEREASGNYGLLKNNLLKDAPLRTVNLTYVDNSRLIARNIAEVNYGFGLSSDAYVTSGVKVVPGFRINQALCFITRKDASPDVLKVIAAFRARATK